MNWVKVGIFRIIILGGKQVNVLLLAPRGGANNVRPAQAERNVFLISQNSTLHLKTVPEQLQSHLHSCWILHFC